MQTKIGLPRWCKLRGLVDNSTVGNRERAAKLEEQLVLEHMDATEEGAA
jgi:hypothetical protein